jgi:hypothetical protein
MYEVLESQNMKLAHRNAHRVDETPSTVQFTISHGGVFASIGVEFKDGNSETHPCNPRHQ